MHSWLVCLPACLQTIAPSWAVLKFFPKRLHLQSELKIPSLSMLLGTAENCLYQGFSTDISLFLYPMSLQ